MSITRDTIEAEIIDRIQSKLSDVLLDDPDRDAKIAAMNRIVSEAVRAVRTNDELKEAVKSFCRTDEAADNLVAYILSWHQSQVDQAVRKARLKELNVLRYQSSLDDMHELDIPDYIEWRTEAITHIKPHVDDHMRVFEPKDKEQSSEEVSK